jgi:hypothetical protein
MTIRSIDYNTFDIWPEMPEQQAVHTPERPFCWDMTCYCHTNQDAIAETAQYVSDGLLSSGEADRLYRGRMV